MILADTSAWVEYDRATGSPVDQRLTELIRGDGPLAVTEPVVMEVTAAARGDDEEAELHRLLLRFDLLGLDTAADFDAATRIFQKCRKAGVSPLGIVDCMIASVAWRHEARLLAADAGLARIAEVIGIELDEASST